MLSTKATTSSPSAFQSIAVRKLKNAQPSVSLARRATSRHCAAGTRTTSGVAAASTVTPGILPSTSRARSTVTSVDLRRRLGAPTGAPALGGLLLEQHH